ncbi:carbohydrate-binding family 9-like protein [Longitalea arenae]|uniref:carbohydrate-binding family 9-like protein n=1 Tax=Longitalea arenae TaxID=2812558 RepID=UPI0019684B5D|nr:carbohydrate-binding family 9-like protein [Longitalea arenae]
MNALQVPYLKNLDQNTPLRDISVMLDGTPKQELVYAPWAEYPYHPQVQFSMAHGSDAVFIKYFVKEKTIRAVNNTLHSPVYTDSCVEFFIGFDDEPAYYNFEFNCIGTPLIGYGEDKLNRSLLPQDITQQIKYKSVLTNDQSGEYIGWELTLLIPVSAFCFHNIQSLKGRNCVANFYKCGDELPEPHFVSWSNIQWPQPNFHLRQFFGSLVFE